MIRIESCWNILRKRRRAIVPGFHKKWLQDGVERSDGLQGWGWSITPNHKWWLRSRLIEADCKWFDNRPWIENGRNPTCDHHLRIQGPILSRSDTLKEVIPSISWNTDPVWRLRACSWHRQNHQGSKTRGIVGCTPTNVPLWDILAI